MYQYDIFLSFSEVDSDQVNILINRLRRDIPSVRIFFDTEENELSEFERTRIIKAIDDSKLVVFAVSENSLSDQNCEKEVMYAKNTSKRVVPYMLSGMTLKGWLLYELGRINCIDSTNEEEVTRFIETLKQKLGYSSENQSDIQISDSSESSTPISTFPTTQTTQTTQTNPSSTSDTSSNSIENQLVFDHRTGEFVSRAVGDIPETALLNVIGDGDLSDTSSNTDESSLVPPKKLYINGHEYVDLGLPSGLKWATCNLGSYRIEDSGTYYAWGEVKPKTPFVIANCQTYLRDKEWLKINDFIDNRGNLTLSHDAARKNWGWAWRMPTKAEIEELQSNTTASWHMVNGIDGCMLKSNINGQCIFFPAFGVKDNRTSRDNGILGMYWTSTVSEDSDIDACRFALGVNLFSLRETPRYRGLSIRPVSE